MTQTQIQWIEFVVEPHYAGLRLDHYLCKKIQRLSRNQVQGLIRNKLRSERPLKASSQVHTGLAFAISREVLPEPETPRDVQELYRDEHLLVVNKPAGLPLHPTARYFHNTLTACLRELYGEGFAAPVHRLDRETSGVVICSRTTLAARRLTRAFAASKVDKEYVAICEGTPPDSFTVDAPIAVGGHVVRIGVRIDHEMGRPAHTDFAVEKRFERDGEWFALVRARPRTGRQHQIRVHLREAGFPLVGDKIYGPSPELYERFVTQTLTDEDWLRLRLSRHALHAARVNLLHPVTLAPVCFEAPLPSELAEFALL